MSGCVSIVGAGLAGSEAALVLARQGVQVRLFEMRPQVQTPVHKTSKPAELVCSNSLKSENPDSAAGMIKGELRQLNSPLIGFADQSKVGAGGALAVDREAFSASVEEAIAASPNIELVRHEVRDLSSIADSSDAIIVATGPLTSDALSEDLSRLLGSFDLAFYDAVAPIVMADSLDMEVVFSQNRYEQEAQGDYLNAPMDKGQYETFIDALLSARRVVAKEFETKELFSACQPIEEIARAGRDAPRFGPMKPVGLEDPRSGKRPWAVLQLRREDAAGLSYNMVGFQTNLAFPDQERVFRMIPGLENAEFSRFGVMHRNTFMDAPNVLDPSLEIRGEGAKGLGCPVFAAGQVSGMEGYCEAIRSGHHAAISAWSAIGGREVPMPPAETAFGSLLAHATSPETKDYQPMHVNFGVFKPLGAPIRNKKARYREYGERGRAANDSYVRALQEAGYALE